MLDGQAYHRRESPRILFGESFQASEVLWSVHAFRADYRATGAKSCEGFDRLNVSHNVWENQICSWALLHLIKSYFLLNI